LKPLTAPGVTEPISARFKMSTLHWKRSSPPFPLRARAGRAASNFRLGSRRRLVATAPRGDGHPVLVLPGLLAGDFSTLPLRRFLRAIGHDARGWGLGVNVGPTDALRRKLDDLLLATRGAHGQRVSLVGWSLGGIYARELARAHRRLTLDMSAWRAAFFDRQGRSLRDAHDLRAYLRTPVPVPTTSIFSRTDGIVHWQSCLETEGPQRENVEVESSHTGMGFHAAVLTVVADRLAQPDGTWRPYAKKG
jgi:hypothetical protein